MLKEVRKRLDTHFNNVLIGFAFNGGLDAATEARVATLNVPCLHTNINTVQVRPSSNVFESDDSFR